MRKALTVVIAILVISSAALAQDVENPVIHEVTYGDTLFKIAQRYGVTVDEIAQANDIVYTWSIQIGQKIVIPGLEAPDNSEVVQNPLVAAAPVQHVIRPGETLAGIARRYGVDPDLILRANNIANPNLIYHGQTLNIWTPQTVDNGSNAAAAVDTPAEAITAEPDNIIETPFIHQVKAGETLGIIARNYGVALSDLISANALSNPDLVYVGSMLTIPGLTAGPNTSVAPSTLAQFAEAAQPTITEGKQIVVDLSDQRVYAFENGQLVFTALASTGLPATPTVLGDYKIYLRLESQTMSGPGYYLPGVQWVQYFYEGYGLHGTYWHNNFGQPMSHGCVNLTNADAYWLFQWASIGTPVHVQL